MDPRAEALLRAGTAIIADMFDGLGKLPMVLDTGLFPVTGPGTAFAGPAYTFAGESHVWPGPDEAKLAAIDTMSPGVVGIWAGNDIRGVCCFGDLLASAMQARGCLGLVVDGGVRDVGYLRTMGLPIFTRYRTPARGIGRWRVTGRQVPVRLRGALEDWVAISPGDFVVADDDGVIVVPEDLVDIVVNRAGERLKAESGARKDIQAGTSLGAAFEEHL